VVSWPRLESGVRQTYSEVEARKKGDVSRNASTAAAPRATSPNLLRCMVFIVEAEMVNDVVNGRSDLVSEAVDGPGPL